MVKSLLLLCFLFILADLNGQTSLVTSPDTTICLGGAATMSATVTSGSYGTSSYTFQSIPYAPEPFTGGTPLDNTFYFCSGASPHDDCVGGPYPIGFNFCFFNQTYTQFYVSSNGWISFTHPPNSWITYNADTLPNSGSNVPKNVIFAPWQDWQPDGIDALNHMFYYTTGTAPNRKLVVYWLNCPMYACTSPGPPLPPLGTFQIVINEQNSIIENNIQYKPFCANNGNKATQGVQDSTGTVAFIVPGRNQTNWTAQNESTRFVPGGIVWYTGGYPGGTVVGYGTPLTVSPSVTTIYTAVVQVCDGSYATGNVTVTVVSANFNYSQPSYCKTEPNPTPAVVNPTGTFTATPPGLVFVNPNTGTVNLGASTPGTYGITYTITSPCFVSSIQNLTINATPAVPTPLATYVSRCGPGQVTFGVVQPPGQTISWYDAPVGGNLLPLAGALVTSNVLSSRHFYAQALLNGTTCISPARADIFVAIKTIPLITNNILAFTICTGDSVRINLTSNPLSVFHWTAFSPAPTLSGYSGGTGNRIAQKLVNTGAVNDTVTYSVVAVADTCTSDTVKFKVTVRPYFDVFAAPLAQSACSGNNVFINLSSSNPATIFTWTATGNYLGLSGFSGGNGNPISQLLKNTGPADGTVIYTVTPNGLGCTGNPVVSTVLVHPLPVPVISGSSSICVGSSAIYSTQPGMTNYLWSVSAGGTVTAGGTINSNTVTVTWNVPAPQSVSVNYQNANGCSDTLAVVYPVTVNPLPGAAGIISGAAVVCQATTGIPYSVGAIANSVSYSWSLVPAAAGTISGNTASVTINWSAGFTGTATLSVLGVNACGTGVVSPAFSILVNPNPVVSFQLCVDSITTPSARPIQLRQGIPLGGSWSGTGVNTAAGTFNPAVAGLGTHTIIYSYTNVYGCTLTAFRTIRVTNPGFFSCGGNTKDVRDNKLYPTVSIGSQCWMSESLNYGSMIGSTQFQFDNCTTEKYCYGDIFANCTGKGGLYQWDEMMAYTGVSGSQGICPPEWHVPSEAEWAILFNNYINNGFAGAPLKSTGYSGFNALIEGVNFFNRSFSFNSFAGFYWSSDSHGPSKAWAHGMNSFNPSVSYYPSSRSNAFSVRCIKD